MSFGDFEWDNGFEGTAPWQVDQAVLLNGQSTLRSGLITHDQSTRLASGPFGNDAGPIVFQSRVDSEPAYDFFRAHLYRNGAWFQTLVSRSGRNQGWQTHTLNPSTLGAGLYRLVFEYAKDASVTQGADVAWIGGLSGLPLIVIDTRLWVLGVRPPPVFLGVNPPSGRLANPCALRPPQGLLGIAPKGALIHKAPLAPPRAVVAPVPNGALSAAPPPLWTPAFQGAPVPRAHLALPLAVSLGARARTVRAQETRLRHTVGGRLSDALPLRRSTDLPRYRVDAWLPWVYGRATLSPVPLDEAGVSWLVADHPIVGVDQVRIGGIPTEGYQLIQYADETGHPVAVITLTAPPKDGASLAVSVIGRRHPRTGALLEHPTDIAQDLLQRCGYPVRPDAFSGLRQDEPGLTLGWVIHDTVSLKQALALLFEPLGAYWSMHPTPMARRQHTQPPVARLSARNTESAQAHAKADGLFTQCRIRFAYDWAQNTPRQTLALSAPEAIKRFGRHTIDVDLPMVRTARHALSIGRARLQAMARPLWSLSVDAEIDPPPVLGDTLLMDHPHLPSGLCTLTAAQVRAGVPTHALTLTLPAGDVPTVVVDQMSRAQDPAQADSLGILYRDGVATFTVLDDAGNPLGGASVTLDATETRTTDSQGRVSFRTERGPHTLTISALGYADFELEVMV
jgi:hypothetical protein